VCPVDIRMSLGRTVGELHASMSRPDSMDRA